MIVKNESKVIKRCFDSVCKYLDHWVICDTGSTDGTQEIIKKYFADKGIPGKLIQSEWVDFGYNRTEAVQAGYKKADYLLLMDADFIFCPKDPTFKDKKNLSADGYQIKYEGGLDYRQLLFASGKKKWKYIGVTHEYITCSDSKRIEKLDSFTINHLADGGCRSDKFERDIRLLTKGLEEEPDNVRYMFYLAQSHKDLGHLDDAIKYYQMRSSKGGWREEVYYALYQIGLCMMRRKDPYENFKDALLNAHNYHPSRLEALFKLINYCRLNEKYKEGYDFGIGSMNASYPSNDMLFIEKDIHDWKFFDELALCAYNINNPLISLKIYKRLMNQDKVPPNQVIRFEDNYDWFKKKYEKIIRSEGLDQSKGNNSEVNGLDKLDKSDRSNPDDGNPGITVILNVNKRINIFEKQLVSILNQSVNPYEIWVCIFESDIPDQFIDIVNKYKKDNNHIRMIISDINFGYYGRFQLAMQVTTPYICFYDDNRFPHPDNLKFYLDLIKKYRFSNSILGQWGWILHKPISNNENWEYSPYCYKSEWITGNKENKKNKETETNRGMVYEVDYLCGHWFVSKSTIYNMFKGGIINFETGEDIKLSMTSYIYNNIKTYCVIPEDIGNEVYHDNGDIHEPIDENILKIRSGMIKKFIKEGYKLVNNRETKLKDNIDTIVDTVNLTTPTPDKKTLCFFCPSYTNIGGSEITINNLYEIIKDYFDNIDILITTKKEEMLQSNPDILITQQRYIEYSLNIADKIDCSVYILIHGPGQFSNYHLRCDLLIYNSDSLLDSEKSFISKSINTMVLQPTIKISQISDQTKGIKGTDKRITTNQTTNQPTNITYIGSNSYNIIKGSDVFVGLASLNPEYKFLHISKFSPINYETQTYVGLRIPSITPSQYKNIDKIYVNKLTNLTVIDQTKDITSVYNDTKILIIPSVKESFGRVAVEAAINGIPVVASGIPGLKEATYGLACYVDDYRDVNAFNRGLHEVMDNYDKYQNQTKEIAERYFNRQKISINNLVNIISDDMDIPISENNLYSGVTFLIRAKNEESNIDLCLGSLVGAVKDIDNVEIVFVDNGSTDNTYSIVEKYINQYKNNNNITIRLYSFDKEIRKISGKRDLTDLSEQSEQGNLTDLSKQSDQRNLSNCPISEFYNWCLGKVRTYNLIKWDADFVAKSNLKELINNHHINTRSDNFAIWFTGSTVFENHGTYWEKTNSYYDEHRVYSKLHGFKWIEMSTCEHPDTSGVPKTSFFRYNPSVFYEIKRVSIDEFGTRIGFIDRRDMEDHTILENMKYNKLVSLESNKSTLKRIDNTIFKNSTQNNIIDSSLDSPQNNTQNSSLDTPLNNPNILFFVYYGYSNENGGTNFTVKAYIDYFLSCGDIVWIFERIPNDHEIALMKPDCILSVQFASVHMSLLAPKWKIPWMVFTYGTKQYKSVVDGYPALVTYPNKAYREKDMVNHDSRNTQTKSIIVRDPVDHTKYEIDKDLMNPTYITLIGDPPGIKGHKIFIDVAEKCPDLKFLLVTKTQYDKISLGKNIVLSGYVKGIENLKEQIYSKTKILMIPSFQEAFGRVSIEATSSGIPCIISKYPGLSEATFEMSNYVDVEDIDTWIKELRRVLGDYDNEVIKAMKIKTQLNYKKDLNKVRNEIEKLIGTWQY